MMGWSKLFAVALVALFFATLITSSVPVRAQAEPTWSTQIIDTNSGQGAAIALDSNNNPHILYYQYENNSANSQGELVYTNSSWTVPNVPINTFINFALDSSNAPHILYNGENGLMVDTWNGHWWAQQTVDPEGGTGFLALDSAGNPQVAYKVTLPISTYGANDDFSMLQYASWNGTRWSKQTLDSPISYDNDVYLALDSNNTPHILYGYDNGHNSISAKYAVWNGSSWNIQTVFSGLAAYGNLVLDSKGNPHFVYAQNDSDALLYASYNGSAWNTQTVVPNADFGAIVAGFLALDRHDLPQIDYYGDGSLMYALWTGKTWDIQTIGTAIDAGPIVVDSNGNPHIVFTRYVGPSSNFGPGYHFYTIYATASESPLVSTPSPSPSVPELSWLITMPLLLSVFAVAVIVRHPKDSCSICEMQGKAKF